MTTESKKQSGTPQAPQKKTGCGDDIVNDFIEDIWKVMTPEMVDHLKCILTEDMGMTKEDADKFISSQREVRRLRICAKKDSRVVRIGPRNQWIKEVSRSIADQMALFIVGVLLSNRNERTKRLTVTVLDHLCKITGEDTTIDTAQTRVEKTMIVVADRIATWIDEAITDLESKMEDKFIPVTSEMLSTVSTVTSETTTTDQSLYSISDEESLVLRRKTTFSGKSTLTEETESEDEEEKEHEDDGSDKKSKEDELSEERSEESVSMAEEASTVEETGEENTEDEGVKEEADTEEVEEEADTEEMEEEEEDISYVESENEESDGEQSEGEEEEDKDEFKEQEEDEGEKEEVEDEEGWEESYEDLVEPIYDESRRRTTLEVEVGDLGRLSELEKEEKEFAVDPLDLIKEDFARTPHEEDKTDRQEAMKKVLDKRFEEIVKDKLERSLDTLVKYDIDEAASTVANWIESILASADKMPKPSFLMPRAQQGPAFEIKQKDGSEYEILQLSSTTVAEKVAKARGLEPPFRKIKLPRTMSPMNLKSANDWADWALGAAKIGEEWGNWLDSTFSDVEKQLLKERGQATRLERYEEWRDWKNKRGREAMKWRVEKQKIKDEGGIWKRKLQKELIEKPEKETRTLSY